MLWSFSTLWCVVPADQRTARVAVPTYYEINVSLLSLNALNIKEMETVLA
jgi:hypothetical protein